MVTHRDIFLDAQGVVNTYTGRYTRVNGTVLNGPGVDALLVGTHAILGNKMQATLDITMEKIRVIDLAVKSKTSCLCGTVKISVEDLNPHFTVCHCETCRTWGGAPFFAVQCGTKVNITGSEKVTVYDSSPWASRGFCSDCGTHLFYRLKKTGEYNMPVGLFPDINGLEMSLQYFSDQRPHYYCFSNETKEMTKSEIMAYFASST